MKLNVLERLTLLGILPKEGNFVTLKVLKSLKDNLGLSEEELKKFEVTQDGERIAWNEKGNEETEIEIGEKATDIIVEALKNLDKDKKLVEQHFSIYEKFVG